MREIFYLGTFVLFVHLSSAAHLHSRTHTRSHSHLQKGVEKDDLMKDEHWRKAWPEGIIDDSTGDEDVLNLPPEKKKPKDKEKE